MRSGMVSFLGLGYLSSLLTDWCRALESIKASKRLSEANFALSIAPNGQPSVLGMFKR